MKTRTITYKNDKAVELLIQYKELSKEVKDFTDQITKLEEERAKVAIKGQKVKDKLNPMIKKMVAKDEGEFEVTSKVEVNQDKDIIVEFADQLEDWKEAYRKRKAEELTSGTK